MMILLQYIGAFMVTLLQFQDWENFVDTVEDLEQIAESDSRVITTYGNLYFQSIFEFQNTTLNQKLVEHYNR